MNEITNNTTSGLDEGASPQESPKSAPCEGEGRPPLRATGRRGQIVSTARRHCEAHGARKLSVSKVASELGVTRELIYYYFDGKKGLVDAVLDDYVIDFADKATLGIGEKSSVETRRMIAILRDVIYEEDGSLRDGFRVIEDLRLREEFLSRATDVILERLMPAGNDGRERLECRGWLKLLTYGLAGTMLHDPSISNAELANMVKEAAAGRGLADGAA